MERCTADPPETSSIKPNPKFIPKNPKSKNQFFIGGIAVEFPYQPYGTQMSFMNRVISTLDRSQSEGHSHALLESPTGTGKSLSLLCSSIAWQQNQKLKNVRASLMHSSSKANPEAVTDPVNYGGGFIPETQPQPSGNPAKAPPAKAPTIFYSTRTHAQITQVIREYKKTTYRVPMAVLGSRKHYCTSPYLRGKNDVDEQCKLLLKNKVDSCPEFKNVNQVRGHPSLKKGGCHEVHDIEDLVKVGQVVKGCSYFAARAMAQEAELVFCPYNYILNPVIRDAMEVDINRSIIIFDEAHNIEDITRDAGSVDVEEDLLLHLQTELGQLSETDGMIYQPLFEMTQDLLSWIDRRKSTLAKRDSKLYSQCWTGDKAIKELHEFNISLQTFPILQECAKKAYKAAAEAEPDGPHLSGMAATALEGLFSSLNYFLSENGVHANDYVLVLQRLLKPDECIWTNTFSLWCLNPAVVFQGISKLSQSVILTSGTLSPLNTFTSELGVQFNTCLEAPHVIDVNSQVWAAAISTGPGNYPLNASYKTADDYAFQDAVGKSLEEICMIVPGGCLVFFPSYKLLDKVSTRWQATGLWSRLNARKPIFVEPRASSQDTFDSVLKDYYDTIHQGTRQTSTKKIRGKKFGLKNGTMAESPNVTKTEGASFLAVCRGKVSEGMDFSDDNARVVVIVGIPFPNINDIKVSQKKTFNNIYSSSKNLLNGNDWYCQQAFRALNQAAGRCIRHKFDHGAIIFLDERFHKEGNRAYISKWLRRSIRLYTSFPESLQGLQSFFRDVKERVRVEAKPSEMSVFDKENIKSEEIKLETRTKHHNIFKSNCNQQHVLSNDVSTGEKATKLTQPYINGGKFDSFFSKIKGEVIPTNDKATNGSATYIDLEYDSPKASRCFKPLATLPHDDFELTIVEETPGDNFRSPITTTRIFSKDDFSSPRTNHSLQQSSFRPTEIMFPEFTTSGKGPATEASNIQPEAEPNSVNSHDWKRRKLLSSTNPLHKFTNPVDIPDSFSSLASSITSDANHINHSDKVKHSTSPTDSKESRVLNTDERKQIFCLRCRNPLGLPENDSYIVCSNLSTSKLHLTSLWKRISENEDLCTSSVDVLVCDKLLVNQSICQTASGQGIWCKEDGCVFNSVFCPFCIDPNSCLGVHVIATDESNNKFQNKIMFYPDCLMINHTGVQKPVVCSRKIPKLEVSPSEVQKPGVRYAKIPKLEVSPAEVRKPEVHYAKVPKLEVSPTEEQKHKAPSSPYVDSSTQKNTGPVNIEKFAYTSPAQDIGWRNPKSRMRLPKKC